MTKVVNATGLAEIKSFLRRRHFVQDWEKNYLRALAERAERQMARGSPPVIELKAWESLSGHVEEFQISDAGITTIHEEQHHVF